MITQIKFQLESKIPGLKASQVKFYCECKALKIDEESADFDVLVALCPKHEEVQRKLDAGEIKPEDAKIPQVRIEQ